MAWETGAKAWQELIKALLAKKAETDVQENLIADFYFVGCVFVKIMEGIYESGSVKQDAIALEILLKG